MAEKIRLSEHFELADFYDAGKYGDVLKSGEEAPAVEAREIDRRILRLMEGLWKNLSLISQLENDEKAKEIAESVVYTR